MSELNELHELPIANRLVDAEVRHWLDRKMDLQLAQYTEGSPERKALDQARHVALDGYTYELTPAILDAIRRAVVTSAPNETWIRNGYTVALWGDPPAMPANSEFDPVPSVYASRGEVEIFDMRLSVDVAEKYAERILAAVQWQRAQSVASRPSGEVES